MRPWVIIGVILIWSLPAKALAQAPSPASDAALGALVEELRLLRQTLERRAPAAARAQLAIARLTLCDQRAARSRGSVERLEGELANADREREHLQFSLRELNREAEQTVDPERRELLEERLPMLRGRMTLVANQRAKVEARLSRAREAEETELARCDEFERWLNDLDRQLQIGQ